MIKKSYLVGTPSESLCLETIINNRGLSRADLANVTGLTKATISIIVKKLLDDSLVTETGIGNASALGGRKPIKLQYNGNSGLSITIDVGNNYIHGLLSYLDGEEISFVQKKIDLLDDTIVNTCFSDIFAHFEQIKPVTTYDIIGVVIAVHGPVFDGETIFTPHYAIDSMKIREITESLVNYPIYLENEANLAALGEYTFTSESASLISINMNSGIGAGIVQEGILQIGAHGFAGEIGHQIVVMNGKKCDCGNFGCLEAYATNQACLDHFAKEKKLDFVNAVILREYFYNHDLDAKEAILENAHYLSLAINNMIVHHDPEVIVVNSSLYRDIPEMITFLKDRLNDYYKEKVIIRNSSLNKKATVLGGTAFNIQKFLHISRLKLKREANARIVLDSYMN